MSFGDRCEDAARKIHEVYEERAPAYGYETREEGCTKWDEVPSNNRALMMQTVAVIAKHHPQVLRDLLDEC